MGPSAGGVADENDLVLAERLETRGIERRLVTEAPALHVEAGSAFGELAGERRVERVTHGRAQHHAGRLQQRRPVLTGVGRGEQPGVVAVAARERQHGAGEVGERPQVVGALEHVRGHHRREAHT